MGGQGVPPRKKTSARVYGVAAALGVVAGYRFIRALQSNDELVHIKHKHTSPVVKKDIGFHIPGHPRRAATATADTPADAVGVVPDLPDAPRSKDDIHVVFSTDCSAYQDWQSFLLFHSAQAAGQTSRMTRIASGCSEEDQARLTDMHRHLPRVHGIHFTPDYAMKYPDGEVYPFNNKPNGLLHFLRHASPPITETVIALVDPDMVVLRPITPYVDENVEKFRPGHPHGPTRGRNTHWVTRGHPVSQSYAYGGAWSRWPELRSFMPADSPVFFMDEEEANRFYTAGPPYLAHTADWLRIAEKWAEYSPLTFRVRPGLLAEMQAWSLAVVQVGLPNTVVYTYMVSDLDSGADEGWEYIDAVPKEGTCLSPAAVRGMHGAEGPDGRIQTLPVVLHYCQLFRMGLYMFAKRHPDLHNIFRCDGPLLLEPPPRVVTMKTKVHPGPRIEEIGDRAARRQIFALCLAIKALNEALKDYRTRSCPASDEKVPILHLTDLQPHDFDDRKRWQTLNTI